MSKRLDLEDKEYINSGDLLIDEPDPLDAIDDNIILYEYLAESVVLYENDEGYSIEKETLHGNTFVYTILDPFGIKIYRWRSFHDYETAKDFTKTVCYQIFKDEVAKHEAEINGEYMSDDDFWLDIADEKPARYDIVDKTLVHIPHIFEKEKGFLDKLTKSNTLVFHRDDPSTVMLKQVYEGKGWDVLTTPCSLIDDDELKELFAKHDRLVFLGHGSSYGLIGMFGPEVAPYMKDKKIFAIWCNADKYFENHNIGKGCFITKNAPSEVWESVAAGCGNISAELMLENITYWSKLCADVVEECLEGDPQKGVDYIRKNYLEQYGNHPVSIYNADSAHVLGTNVPLPEYTFKGKPLEPKDYPVPDFDEEAFLKHPVANIRDLKEDNAKNDSETSILEALSASEIWAEYYSDIPEEQFKAIIEIDPTTKDDKMGKYSKWLINLFKAGVDVVSESQEFKDQLQIFDKNKHKHNEADRDIGKIKSIEELIDLNHKYEEAVQKSEYELRAGQVPGVEVLGDTANWEIYMPKTYEASKYLRGQNAVWCTGRHNDDSYWKSYNRDSDLIIFINKKDRDTKYQGAFHRKDKELDEFRDARNKSIDFIDFIMQDNYELFNFAKDNPYFKNIKEVKETKAIIDFTQGKPFIYDGQPAPEKLAPFIKNIEFKSTELVADSFKGCAALTEVKLPEGVETVPAECFSGCTALTKVTLPSTITKIGILAFGGCEKLKEINLPESLKEIGLYAFKGCDDVTLNVKRGTKFSVKLLDGPFIKEHLKWEEKK